MGNPNHDDKGRFSSGGGGDASGASTSHSPAMQKALNQIDAVFGKAQADASPSGAHANPGGLGAHGRTVDAAARGKPLPPSTGDMHLDIANAVARGMSRWPKASGSTDFGDKLYAALKPHKKG